MKTLDVQPEETEHLESIMKEVLIRTKSGKTRDNLKTLLNALVDKQYIEGVQEESEDKGPFIPENFSLVEQTKMKIAQASFDLYRKNQLMKSVQESRLTSFSVPKADTSLRMIDQCDLSKESRTHFSEFGARVKSHGFGSTERDFKFSVSHSPGPAHYSPQKSTLNSPPSFLFDKSQVQRSQFLNPKKDTPGPPQYFPSKHYLSL